MTDLPRINPRDRVLAEATSELQVFVARLIENHGLTYGELAMALGNVLMSWAKWQIKEERAEP